LSINSSNSSKLELTEDLGIPDIPLEWFIDIGVKWFNHVVKRELVFCNFADFNFLRQAKIYIVKKLVLGCMGLFEVSD